MKVRHGNGLTAEELRQAVAAAQKQAIDRAGRVLALVPVAAADSAPAAARG